MISAFSDGKGTPLRWYKCKIFCGFSITFITGIFPIESFCNLMPKKRTSLTFTIFAGYFLLSLLAVAAVWFIYEEVIRYTSMAQQNREGNEKLIEVGEAAAKLYEAESLSRQIIQSQDTAMLPLYNAKIDSIKAALDALQDFRDDSLLDAEIDSINSLLSQKTENLAELLKIRARGATESYYSRALSELRKVDETFDDPDYEERFRDLEPHQRRVLIKLLEYAEMESPDSADISVDSLVTSVKSVLLELESQERRYRQALRTQEETLLTNEIQINNRLRGLLSTIEAAERESSLARVEAWQSTVEKTSKVIAVLGAASLLVIFISVLLVLRDLSKSQEYRRRLEQAKSYAEALLKSREQFMNTVTHDLRSPLNAVVGYLSLLEKTEVNRTQNRYLGQIRKASDFILHLVNDLLDLSKLDAGKMHIDMLPFNAKQLIEETVENSIPPEKSPAVRAVVKISPELNRRITADPFRIKQILMNLVSNAFKFTDQGEVRVTADLLSRDKDPVLRVSVKDTGIGISESQKEKIFEEFSQEDSTIEKRYGGSGLGLAISKKLTQLLGGNISVESTPGEGSNFTVTLPVTTASEEEETVLPAPGTKAAMPPILVVDDEPSQRDLIGQLLKNNGIPVFSAADGKQALQILDQEEIALVLTDIQMPEMDGVELLQAMQTRSDLEGIPVIAVSGQAQVSREEYLSRGFSGSLLKPYSSEALISIIEKLLRIDLNRSGDIPDQDTGKSYSLFHIRKFSGEDREAL